MQRLVHNQPDRVIQSWVMDVGAIQLCSFTVPLSTQVYKWVQVNCCWNLLCGNLHWTSHPEGEGRTKTPAHLIPNIDNTTFGIQP